MASKISTNSFPESSYMYVEPTRYRRHLGQKWIKSYTYLVLICNSTVFTTLQVCNTHNPDLPTLSSSPYSALSANAAANGAPLPPNPPDEIFLERLAERFAQHPNIDVGGGRPASSATRDDDDDDDEDRGGDERGDHVDDGDNKAGSEDKLLYQHCFR
jgi:hypothetical protein